MDAAIAAYHRALAPADRALCELLAAELTRGLPNATSRVWHGHPVWFLGENPIAGYDRLKECVRLLFWSGQSFDEPGLRNEGTFKAAEARYVTVADVDVEALRRWLKKAAVIQWDYGNIVKRRGVLVRLDLPPGPEATFLKVPESRKTGGKRPASKLPTSRKAASKKAASKKAASKKAASKKAASKKAASKKLASKKLASKKLASKKLASKKPAPKKPASKTR